MGWIKDRIDAEYRKHYRVTGGLDWSKLAEQKILSNIRENIKNSGRILQEHDFQTEAIEFSMTGELISVEILEDVISGAYNNGKQNTGHSKKQNEIESYLNPQSKELK